MRISKMSPHHAIRCDETQISHNEGMWHKVISNIWYILYFFFHSSQIEEITK